MCKKAKPGERKLKGKYFIVKVERHPIFGSRWVKEHCLVWAEAGMKLPDWERTREIIHHKDGNPLNNEIGNLQLITQAEHVRLHNPRKGKKHSEETKKKLSAAKVGNRNRAGVPHSEEIKQRISESCKRWYQTPEGQAKIERMKR